MSDKGATRVSSSGVSAYSTIGPGGKPQTTVTWLLLDDDGLVQLSLNPARQKLRNLRRNPAASRLFVNPQKPFQTVELRATATATVEGDVAERVARYNARYDIVLRAYDQPGDARYTVILEPEKVLTFGLQAFGAPQHLAAPTGAV